MLTTLVLATRNAGKVRELQALLADIAVCVRSLEDWPAFPYVKETGATFEDNARLKAAAVADFTGLPAVADDSGLEVAALGGAPGVFSARYAGENADDAANNRKLLKALDGIPMDRRRAAFRCVAVLQEPGRAPLSFEGRWEGYIAETQQGERGFGYDPLFVVPELGKTAAELTVAEKNRLSHRGQAMARLKDHLRSLP